ncbi:MAG: Trp family transcriptional regulator [Desulfobacterales bacterium]
MTSSHEKTKEEPLSEELAKVFAEIRDKAEMAAFLREILTPKEISDLSKRWELLKDLFAGETQRHIAAKHRISLCKITRGSKILRRKNSATLQLLKKYYG